MSSKIESAIPGLQLKVQIIVKYSIYTLLYVWRMFHVRSQGYNFLRNFLFRSLKVGPKLIF